MDQRLFRIIDANLNRAREGLRVSEDIIRFMVRDKGAAKSLKRARHSVTNTLLRSKKLSLRKLVCARDTKSDVLKHVDFQKNKKTARHVIFMSNIQRAKESLRVLEECCKIIDKEASQKYRELRFKVYDIEKEVVMKL